MLYVVRVGQDEYRGRADEVVAFMVRAEGAPGEDARAYMAGVARRIEEKLGIAGIRTDDPQAFLDSLDEHGVLAIQTVPEPSDERVDPREAIGDGPIAYGPGVDPDDVP